MMDEHDYKVSESEVVELGNPISILRLSRALKMDPLELIRSVRDEFKNQTLLDLDRQMVEGLSEDLGFEIEFLDEDNTAHLITENMEASDSVITIYRPVTLNRIKEVVQVSQRDLEIAIWSSELRVDDPTEVLHDRDVIRIGVCLNLWFQIVDDPHSPVLDDVEIGPKEPDSLCAESDWPE